MLIHILALLALSSFYVAIAMEPSPFDTSALAHTQDDREGYAGRAPLPKRSHKTITLQPREAFEPLQLNWPQELTLLDLDEPITDKYLLELNPEWRLVRDDCTAETKEQIFSEVQQGILCWVLGDNNTHRTLSILMVCTGWDPNRTAGIWNLLKYSADHNDVQFAKYLLQKGAKPNSYLEKCRTVEMAKLFIDHGAQIPKDILYVTCASEAQAELLQFYLDMGYVPKPAADHHTPFHGLMRGRQHQPQKARLLLQFCSDLNLISYQNLAKCTAIHNGAITREKKEVCMVLISHFVDQHQNFITLLGCLKKQYPLFYRHKDVRFCFKEFSPMRKLRHLLSLKDDYERTAYQLSHYEEFNPATCTYEKFMKFRNPEQESKRAKTDPIQDEK